MPRLCSSLLLSLLIATAANAATLSVTPNKLTYFTGETITLTISGDDAGATARTIFGRLDYSGVLLNNGTRSQTQLVGQSGNWHVGSLSESDNGIQASSSAFDQAAPFPVAVYDTALNLPGTLSIVTLIAAAVGVVDVSWHTASDADALNFFGLTNANGTSFTIVSSPEPGTAALIALGLLGLVGWRRVRV
jgi:hypothetical protein